MTGYASFFVNLVKNLVSQSNESNIEMRSFPANFCQFVENAKHAKI